MTLLAETRRRAKGRKWSGAFLAPPHFDRVDTSPWYGAQRRVFREGVITLGWVLTAPTAVFSRGDEDDFGTVLVVGEPALEAAIDLVWDIVDELFALHHLDSPPPAYRQLHQMMSLEKTNAPVWRSKVPGEISRGFTCEVARVLFQRRDRQYQPLLGGPLALLVNPSPDPVMVLPHELCAPDLLAARAEFAR